MVQKIPEIRLFVEGNLATDGPVELNAAQVHYLRNVLRRPSGSELGVFNGQDGEWLARFEESGKRSAIVTPLRQLRGQASEPDLWLLFAPVKRARIDYLVEKATELGVAALQPVWTERTIVERVNLERLRANAIEAAEQTERLTVPSVREPVRLLEMLRDWPANRLVIFCDERGVAPPIATVLEELPQAARQSMAVLIGPEGGFSQTELDALHKLAFVRPVGLGPRILRADTAALAALAVAQALIGDWRNPRSR